MLLQGNKPKRSKAIEKHYALDFGELQTITGLYMYMAIFYMQHWNGLKSVILKFLVFFFFFLMCLVLYSPPLSNAHQILHTANCQSVTVQMQYGVHGLVAYILLITDCSGIKFVVFWISSKKMCTPYFSSFCNCFWHLTKFSAN